MSLRDTLKWLPETDMSPRDTLKLLPLSVKFQSHSASLILRQHKPTFGSKGLPANFVSYVNILTTLCPRCPGQVCSGYHLKEKHNLNILTPKEIIKKAWEL